MGISVDDDFDSTTFQARRGSTAQQRRSNPTINAAYKTFTNSKLRQQYATMPHDKFMAMLQKREEVVAQAPQKLKEAFVINRTFPDVEGRHYLHAVVTHDISTITRAIDPAAHETAKVIILEIPDADILGDFALLQPLINADKYLTQVKVLLIPWSIVEDKDAITLAALRMLTAECSTYRWQVIFINDTNETIITQEHMWDSSATIFSKTDNIQSWKLLREPVASPLSTYFQTYFFATEEFEPFSNQFKYASQQNSQANRTSYDYYNTLSSMISDSRKPYFSEINAQANWYHFTIQSHCLTHARSTAFSILTNSLNRACYLMARSHDAFLEEQAHTRREAEAARKAAQEEQARRDAAEAQRQREAAEKQRQAAEEKTRRAATNCPHEQCHGFCFDHSKGKCDYKHRPQASHSSGYGYSSGGGSSGPSYSRPGASTPGSSWGSSYGPGAGTSSGTGGAGAGRRTAQPAAATPEKQTAHEILGVPVGASLPEVKKAYFKTARVWAADKVERDPAKVEEALTILVKQRGYTPESFIVEDSDLLNEVTTYNPVTYGPLVLKELSDKEKTTMRANFSMTLVRFQRFLRECTPATKEALNAARPKIRARKIAAAMGLTVNDAYRALGGQ